MRIANKLLLMFGGGKPKSWTPTSLSPVLFLDAIANSTPKTPSTNVTSIAASGKWGDTITAAQATTAEQAAYQTNGLAFPPDPPNGPSFYTLSAALTNLGAFAMWAQVVVTSVGTSIVTPLGSSASGSVISFVGPDFYVQDNAGSSWGSTDLASYPAGNSLMFIQSDGAGNVYYRITGMSSAVLLTPNLAGGDTFKFTLDELGGSQAGSFYNAITADRIARVVVASSPTAPNITKMNSWIAANWGVTF